MPTKMALEMDNGHSTPLNWMTVLDKHNTLTPTIHYVGGSTITSELEMSSFIEDR